MGTLTISSKHSETVFSYVENDYTLEGTIQIDSNTNDITGFNSSVSKKVNEVQTNCGSISSNYSTTGLSYNLYNMYIDDLIAIPTIVKNCIAALTTSTSTAKTSSTSDVEK